ncbi:uncharacterized mitochondrial protein AtMg00310-like [Lathyrus oleraceus]|uniref:uncharacterized mitochondrial protein AtMg00310-like n=1 Tax=Pisum sativum TaxID=3888 RepID=UPI0021D33E3F|nr:uncharacterized mitochondrial protein AtMg00310-like [Pisum sativum]
MVLMNAVISAIIVYTMSFYKAPSKVMKEITSIHNNFSWNNTGEKRNVHCISWTKVCKDKEDGGLRAKNISMFNKALLLKWKWRILIDKEAYWSSILNHRYYNPTLILFTKVDQTKEQNQSIRWRDMFIENVICSIGDGRNISFWKSKWINNQTLKNLFPSLLIQSELKEASVADMGCGTIMVGHGE